MRSKHHPFFLCGLLSLSWVSRHSAACTGAGAVVHAAQVMPRSARGIAEDVRFPLSLYELVTTSRLPAIISLVPRLILKPDLKINGSLMAQRCKRISVRAKGKEESSGGG